MKLNTEIAHPGLLEGERFTFSRAIWKASFYLFLISLFAFGAYLSRNEVFYTSDSDLAYYLGIAGGVSMLVLFLYPLRKYSQTFRVMGPIRFWFKLHMICGIAGPSLILFHSTFRIGATNSQVALFSMLVVMASGIIGRFIYKRIHNGLYGQKATLSELHGEFNRQTHVITSVTEKIPALNRYIADVTQWTQPNAVVAQRTISEQVAIGIRTFFLKRQCFRLIEENSNDTGKKQSETTKQLLNRFFDVAVKTAQFSLYERLFRLWHVLHVPFVFLMVVCSVVHIVAVHMY